MCNCDARKRLTEADESHIKYICIDCEAEQLMYLK